MSASAPVIFNFQPAQLVCHAFNKDRTQLALCPNSHLIHIYSFDGKSWNLNHVLEEHDKLVTGLDWAPESNRIVSCSQDRNAYVWNFNGEKWTPTLVLLRINRGATSVRWSPKEDKFAVGSSSRCIAVCYFEPENNWWVSKHLKKPIRSTVLSIDWHPNNVLIACGAADYKARVLSAFVKNIDQKPSPTLWGEKVPFNTICHEDLAETGGWVHSVSFSPSGDILAYTAHDATVYFTQPGKPTQKVRLNGLPVVSLTFVSETSVIAAGHDCTPIVVSCCDGTWKMMDKLDQGKKKTDTSSTAFNMFKQMDSKRQTSKEEPSLQTLHQNTITEIRPYAGELGKVHKLSSIGLDGQLIVWDLLEPSLKALQI